MKPWMKVLMWLGLGAGLGFSAGFMAGLKKGLEGSEEAFDAGKKYRDEEIARDQEKADRKIAEYRGDISTTEGIDRILKETEETDDVTPLAQVPEDEEPEMPTEEDVMIDADIPQLHPQHLVPEIIGEEEFNANIWQYDLESLVFYEMDEVLYDETTQSIIENPDDVVGIGTLFEFGGDPNNPVEGIYVKNDTFGTLFRIDRVDAAFCDQVDGTAGPTDQDPADNREEEDDYWDDV